MVATYGGVFAIVTADSARSMKERQIRTVHLSQRPRSIGTGKPHYPHSAEVATLQDTPESYRYPGANRLRCV